MSLSLRDQLLQAGLLTQKQVEQADRQQRDEKRQHHKQRPTAPKSAPRQDPAALRRAEQEKAAAAAAAAKAARDAEINRQQKEKAERKARLAQVKQLVEQNRLPPIESDDYFNFIDGTRIRRLPVDAATRARLIAGQLAVVRCEGRYSLVPAEVGQRIRERDERSFMTVGTQSTPPPADPDDPYKDFVVPDDLVW